MEKIRPFSGEYNVFNGNYYIHFHQQNIGLAGGRTSVPNIVKIFQSYREMAGAQSMEAYKSLFKANITQGASDLLNDVFSDTDILVELDNQIREKLQGNIDSSGGALVELSDIQKSLMTGSDSFIETFQRAGESIRSFDSLLDALSKAVALVEGDGGPLAAAIQQSKSNGKQGYTIKAMGSKLQSSLNAALEEYLKTHNGETTTAQQMTEAVRGINNLASAMISKETKKGTSYSKNSIKKLVDDIFNTNLAEGIAAVAAGTGSNALDETFSSINLTGSNKNKLYSYTPEKGWSEYNNNAQYGKADSIQKNFQMSFNYHIGSTERIGEIEFNLGLSNKFFRTQGFKGQMGNNKKTLTFGGGSAGLTVGDTIYQLFGSSFTTYLGYNVIAHRSSRPAEAQELQNLITRRYITNFLATRGGSEDFAQYIVMNGEVISILELILYINNNFVGLSKSTAKGSDQPVTISMPDTPEIESLTQTIIDNKRRTQMVNSKINTAKMKIEVHAHKLLNAYSPSDIYYRTM